MASSQVDLEAIRYARAGRPSDKAAQTAEAEDHQQPAIENSALAAIRFGPVRMIPFSLTPRFSSRRGHEESDRDMAVSPRASKSKINSKFSRLSDRMSTLVSEMETSGRGFSLNARMSGSTRLRLPERAPKPNFTGLGNSEDRGEERGVFGFGGDPVFSKFLPMSKAAKATESRASSQTWKESTFWGSQLLAASSDQKPSFEDNPLPFSTPRTTGQRHQPTEISPFLKTSKTRVPFLKFNGNTSQSATSAVFAEEPGAIEENIFMRQRIRLEKEGGIEHAADEAYEEEADGALFAADQTMMLDLQGAKPTSSDDTFEDQNRAISKASGLGEDLTYENGFNQDAEDPLACSPTFAQAILTSSRRLGTDFQSPSRKRQEARDNEDAKTFAGNGRETNDQQWQREQDSSADQPFSDYEWMLLDEGVGQNEPKTPDFD